MMRLSFVVLLLGFSVFFLVNTFTPKSSPKINTSPPAPPSKVVNNYDDIVPPWQELPDFEPIEPEIESTIWREIQLDEELEAFRPDVQSDWMEPIALVEPERFVYAHEGDSLNISILDLKPYTFTVDEVTYTSSGARHWNGHDTSNNRFISVTHLNKTTLATLLTERGSYSIRLTKGKGWVYQDQEPNFHGDTLIEESSNL